MNLRLISAPGNALDCYQNVYNPLTGIVSVSTANNCVYCIYEQLFLSPSEQKQFHACSVYCWPYELATARRVCCQSALCNRDYTEGKHTEYD
ncbi:hypothetical protein EG68_12005 [Paragonimus skrjabini miyazakii]|uniref:Uncharacterized protein n=1 Tax=Paragonimus skrjabini miyazakii TaxID=59628 RepID=A0A8S9YCI4_9TREM|nr:hypothetical protein EG68_12005 [Paragonimus skrjabini miyazakii]